MDKIHNLYITSASNKAGNNNYNCNLYFSKYGIQTKEDEDAYLNITSFQTLNTFYKINSYSKTFKIKVKTDMDINFTYNFILEEGNYNIQEFQDLINTTCSQYLEINYNHYKNKWVYISKQTINNEVSIMPTTFNSKYFGFSADVWTVLPTVGNLLSNQINLNNFGLIVIKVIGLIQENRTLDNLNKNISSGDICALVSRQDVAVNALVNWVDYNKTFIK